MADDEKEVEVATKKQRVDEEGAAMASKTADEEDVGDAGEQADQIDQVADACDCDEVSNQHITSWCLLFSPGFRWA
jgi:hypothetical protein